MGRILEVASARSLALLTVLAGTALQLLSPALLTLPAEQSSAAVAALALVVAALVVRELRLVPLAGLLTPVAARASDGPHPVPTSRITDPVHQPRRPRAPGSA